MLGKDFTLELPEDIAIKNPIGLTDGYFDLKGLSAYCSLAVGTLRDYIRAGKLPCFKVKGKILVRRSEFDHWMEVHRMNRKEDLDALVNDVLDGLKQAKSDG